VTDDPPRKPEENVTEQAARLTLIGYWAGPDTTGSWPSPVDFVDLGWDQDDRDYVSSYLAEGRVVWGFMGYSPCRFCGVDNGDLELSDGTYLWPSGLAHYLIEHGVRLPDEFVEHAYARTESLEQASRDEKWWASATPPPPTAAAGAPRVREETLQSKSRSAIPDVQQGSAALAPLEGRDAVVEAVRELRRELAAGPEDAWENDTLERFLDGFGELLGVIERSYTSTARDVPTNPWVLVADALRGARHYE
jgi:hypothetical protein